jgi:hypothetical protein
MTNATETPQHATCSPSGSRRWLNCPGSIGFSLSIRGKLPEEDPQPDRDEGTETHALGAACLKMAFKMTPEVTLSEFTPKQGASVAAYVEKVEAFVARFDSTPKIRIEEIIKLDLTLSLWGTADFLATGLMDSIPTGVVVDYKNGTGVTVLAEESEQLALYACCLRQSSKLKLERVFVAIVQPNAIYEEDRYTEVEYNTKELDAWEATFRRGADRALYQVLSKKYELAAGSWCQFCPAKALCPKRAETMKVLDISPDADIPALPPVEALTVEQIGRIAAARKQVTNFVDDVASHARHAMLDGAKFPGVKLVLGRGSRSWKIKEESDLAQALILRGVDNPYEEPGIMSPAQVEKKFGKAAGKAVADIVAKYPGNPTVAPLSDPKPEFIPDGQLFSDDDLDE